MDQHSPSEHAHASECCAEVFESKSKPGTVLEAQKGFGAMLRAVQSRGVLDRKTKELILLSLVIHSRCGACFDAHVSQARGLGVSDAEIEEAAWCAIAMGGAPVRMFFQECLARLQANEAGSLRST
jgi:AhpD family alkylhydroperoxidase